MDSRTTPGPATLRHHDTVIGTLRAAGFSIAMAAHAFSAARQLHLRVRAPGGEPCRSTAAEETAEVAQAILAQLPADEYPHLDRADASSTSSGPATTTPTSSRSGST